MWTGERRVDIVAPVYDLRGGPRKETRQDAAGRHAIARAVIRLAAKRDLLAEMRGDEPSVEPRLRLTGIDLFALAHWKHSWLSRRYAGGWDWKELYETYEGRPARFEVALWWADELCGLALGKISEGRDVIRVDWMEGKAGKHPLKGRVALLVADIAFVFAQAYKSRVVRFQNPLPGVISLYEELGFTYVDAGKNHRYCERSTS